MHKVCYILQFIYVYTARSRTLYDANCAIVCGNIEKCIKHHALRIFYVYVYIFIYPYIFYIPTYIHVRKLLMRIKTQATFAVFTK